jgi:hypothetical protein
MKELQQWQRGEIQSRTRAVYVPDDVDVHAVRAKSPASPQRNSPSVTASTREHRRSGSKAL